MSISIDGATSQVDLKELLSRELKDKNLDGTEAGSSVVLNGDGVTISVSDPVTGETVAKTVPAGEVGLKEVVEGSVQAMYAMAAVVDEIVDMLGAFLAACGFAPPSGETSAQTVSEMSLEEVAQALQEEGSAAGEEVTNGDVLSEASDSEDTFFDVYALMALLMEVGQKEREAARDLKVAELNTEVASIETQAAKQREAGILGAIVSGITLCAQLVMSAVSVVKSTSSIKSAYNTGAAQDANLAETKSAMLQEQAKGPEAANANLEGTRAKMAGTDAGKTVQAAMEEAGVPEAKSAYEAAQAEEAKLTEGQTPTEGGDTPDPKIQEAKAKTAAAQESYLKALDAAQAKVDGDYETASTNTSLAEQENIQNPSKDNANAATACQQQQKAAGNASKLMAAEVAAAKAEMGVKPSAEELAKSNAAATQAGKAMMENPAFSQAQNRPWSGLLRDLPQMVGNLGQNCAQMASSLANAEATASQADQKTAEMYREETNSLFTQAQDLIAAARDCCKAIIQAESQSIEQIIRA